jgi:hypothetical protein
VSEPSRPFGPGAALLLFLVYYAAFAVVLLIGDSLSDGPVGLVFYVAAAVLAPLVAAYVGLLRHAPDEPTTAALGLELPRGRTWLHLGLALIVGVALAPLVWEVVESVAALLPKDEVPDEVMVDLRAAAQEPATQVLFFLLPLTRQIFLRGLILRRLRDVIGARRAVGLVVMFDVVTEPLYAVVHALPFSIIALASRSTWAPIVANLALVATPTLLDPLFEDHSPPALLIEKTVVAMTALALAWRLRVEPPA